MDLPSTGKLQIPHAVTRRIWGNPATSVCFEVR
jgi:hypothetical protein